MKKEKSTIFGLHESDSETFFKRIGLLDKFRSGKVLCDNCGKKIELRSNLGYFTKSGSAIKFFCSDCLSKDQNG